MIQEERDLAKLKLKQVANALAIPVLSHGNQPIGVLQVYNFFEGSQNEDQLSALAKMVGSVLAGVDRL